MLKLRNSKYLESDFINSLNIHECKYQYEVFEKVFMTIAQAHNVKWQDIYHANMKSKQNYLLFCISSILIDKLLRIEFRLSIISREILLRNRMNEIVKDYYKFL